MNRIANFTHTRKFMALVGIVIVLNFALTPIIGVYGFNGMIKRALAEGAAHQSLGRNQIMAYSLQDKDLDHFTGDGWSGIRYAVEVGGIGGVIRKTIGQSELKNCTTFQNVPSDIAVSYWDGEMDNNNYPVYKNGTGMASFFACEAIFNTNPEMASGINP